MLIDIRRVVPGDEKTLAYIQTESWKAAFAGILDEATLEKCTDPARAEAMYRGLIEENKGNGYILTAGGKPHCIAWWDAARDADFEGKAELICIHSLPSGWRRGCGRLMTERVLADMRAAGFTEAMLWVFRDNHRARAFYEALGFSFGSIEKLILGTSEICYEKRL